MLERGMSIIDFFKYLRTPDTSPEDNFHPIVKVMRSVAIWSLAAMGLICLAILISITTKLSGMPMDNHAISEAIKKNDPIEMLIFGAILAPLMEELAFRLGLRPGRIRLSVGAVFFGYYAFLAVTEVMDTRKTKLSESMNDLQPLLATIIILCSLVIGVWVLLGFNKIRSSVEKFHEKNFRVIFYGLAICFGLIHAANFNEIQKFWYLIPIVTSPQILLGITLGYIRMRYGVFAAILAHGLHNATALFIALAIIPLSKGKLDATPADITKNFENLSGVDALRFTLFLCAWLGLMLFLYSGLIYNLFEFFKSRQREINRHTSSSLLNLALPGMGHFLLNRNYRGSIFLCIAAFGIYALFLPLFVPAAYKQPMYIVLGLLLGLVLLCVALFASLADGYRAVNTMPPPLPTGLPSGTQNPFGQQSPNTDAQNNADQSPNNTA